MTRIEILEEVAEAALEELSARNAWANTFWGKKPVKTWRTTNKRLVKALEAYRAAKGESK